MKILLLIADITIGGGAERVVVNLANVLFELGYDVKIFSFYKQGTNIAYKLNEKIEVAFLYKRSQHIMRNNIFYKLTYKYYESFLLKREYKDIDVMIFNNCPHFPFFKNKNTKYINFIHNHFKKYRVKNNYFDALVVLSAKQINQWRKYHKNVWVIPNFLPYLSDINSTLSQKNILSIGRMTANDEKGFLRLIEIWKLVQENIKYKEWTLTIVGEGEFKNTIENKIKEYKLENSIILKSFTKDIEKEYLQSSIYIMCSYWEGFGMVLVESANYAIPSIAFNVDTGPGDIIENGKNGYLIEDGNLQEFANKLCLLMDDENLRKQMGQSAKENISHNFSKEKVIQKWQELLNS